MLTFDIQEVSWAQKTALLTRVKDNMNWCGLKECVSKPLEYLAIIYVIISDIWTSNLDRFFGTQYVLIILFVTILIF